MRKFLFLVLMAISFISSGQPLPLTPWFTSAESYSQMLSFKPNAAGAYFDQGLALGLQKDTSCSTCRQSPLRLAVASLVVRNSPSKDTCYPARLNGTGNITLAWQTFKGSTTSVSTPTVIATPYHSTDGYSWVPISGLTAQTLIPTAVFSATTAPKANQWSFIDKSNLYYMVDFAVTGDTAVCQAAAYFQKKQTYYINK